MKLTVKEALTQASGRLARLEDGEKSAAILLAHILGQPATFLWAHPDSPLTDTHVSAFYALVTRAANHEPLGYILGKTEFMGLPIQVDPRVLIPRPETEWLVEAALDILGNGHPGRQVPCRIVDVGTGSGCIAIALSKRMPALQIWALDISPEALEVAQDNAQRLGATYISFMLGSLLEPLAGRVEPGSIDLIVANLPYISDDEFPGLPDTVRRFEPALALRSGPDADYLNRQLLAQARQWLRPCGAVLYETTNGCIERWQAGG